VVAEYGRFSFAANLHSAIRNPQSTVWLTRPGSQKLGAKWVEVTVECEAGKTRKSAI